jgi:hypothetical protein
LLGSFTHADFPQQSKYPRVSTPPHPVVGRFCSGALSEGPSLPVCPGAGQHEFAQGQNLPTTGKYKYFIFFYFLPSFIPTNLHKHQKHGGYNAHMPPTDTPTPKTPQNSTGPMVGIIIIVIVLLAGAVYFLFNQIQNKRNVTPPSYIPGDQA